MKNRKSTALTIAALAAFAAAASFAAPGEVVWAKPLCKEPNRYIGWPTIARCADGRLLAVFSGDRDGHVCPWGKVQMVRSSDGGETWSAPETIRNSPLDDRDAGIMELANGDLVLTWFTSLAFTSQKAYERHAEKVTDEVRIKHLGFFTVRSTDGGKTWEKPVRTRSSTPHGGIQLKDGRLMMAGREFVWIRGMADGDPRKGRKDPDSLFIEVSEDFGRSWKVAATLVPPPGRTVGGAQGLSEPTIAQLPNGKIVVQVRTETPDQEILQSESVDGGKTWTRLHATPLHGLPPHLLALRDGRLLSTYTRRQPWDIKTGRMSEIRACISDDGGETWNVADETILARNTNGDLGYTSTVELDDGRLLTAYYMADTNGGKCCLMGTKWKTR